MIPIWVYFVVAGIIFSALMTIKSAKEDRDIEMESIEREGDIYMKRLEKEKEERQRSFGA
ncbi:sporulation YhaL family protein [Cytobacillus spongiae]|uniref:sporulation YhaL family protein n=1 Tax=Cytobacillus spongiae TaxID=2901381 RepID=UPI001F3351CA|nr:sporulation YhaL family protein [Cytobacillus spongiae]UII56879.1 sporulation YhaL family protein [Cytobacillus spongiae]